MAEYIEREKVMYALLNEQYGYLCEDAIRTIPAADVRPVVRGKWIDRDDKYYGWNMWACSACGEEFVLTEGTPDMNEYHFCPNCGADMRKKTDEAISK